MRYARRRFVVALTVLGLLVAGLTTGGMVTAPSASAANGANFDPGNIISDTVFYNSKGMSAGEIQSFLIAKVPTCDKDSACLKSYRQSTPTRSADGQCAKYTGASNENAATIIYKVAQACDINPQVLLVTLQKEQGLVTDTWPSATQYRIAMGFGCPDTAACASEYFGFFNQVYNAAWQFQRYRDYPTYFKHIAGRTINVLYSPASGCGTKSVYIQNDATAALYNYTPYTPNKAALDNMYGVGDRCSSYGNRNFWAYFVDWFGSTQGYAAAPQLKTLWNQTGGSNGTLGYATKNPSKYPDGGLGQEFQKGWAYWGPSTGAFATSGHIGYSYVQLVGPKGLLGYPIAAQKNEPGGAASQVFQTGALYTTPADKIHRVDTTILKAYVALGGAGGSLGFPTDSTRTAPNGGLSETFDKGSLYWTADTGAISVPSAILAAYNAAGGPGGKLGYPIVGTATATNGTSTEQFENGTITWSSTASPTVTMRPLPTVARFSGSDRYATAVAISKAGFPKTAPVVYVATGQDYPDALAAAPAATKQGGPLLLTQTSVLPATVTAEIKRLKPAKIVIIGGTGVVSAAVATKLAALAPTKRLAGHDRYDTSNAIVNYAFSSASTVYLATGTDYPDALSAAAAAGTEDAPVVLVDGRKSTIPAATTTLLQKLKPSAAVVAGGTSAVSSGIQSAAAKIAKTTRFAGGDRFQTNQLINRATVPTATQAMLATGYDFPDALAGSVLAGTRSAPLYLVSASCVPDQAWLNMNVAGVTSVSLLGGTGVLGSGITKLNRCD